MGVNGLMALKLTRKEIPEILKIASIKVHINQRRRVIYCIENDELILFFITLIRPCSNVHLSFHVPNLIAIWVDPNDISSTVDSDRRRTQWYKMLTCENKFQYFMRQVRHMRSSTFETKSLHSRNSHVDHEFDLNSWVDPNQMCRF